MTPDLESLNAHAEAVDALFADNVTRLNALIQAQGVLSAYDRSPMREMALQGLNRSIVNMERVQSALSPYSRTLRLYISEIERK